MKSLPAPTNITILSGSVPVVLTVWRVDPAATTVVFYPGTMSGAHYYRALLEQIAAQGVNVVGLHPLSHGDSPSRKYLFTFEDIVQNGRDAVLWARHHMKGPVVIAGHSQGGIAALAHALASFGTATPAPEASPATTAYAAPAPLPNTADNAGLSIPAGVSPLLAQPVQQAPPDTSPSPLPDAAFLLCTLLPQHPRAIEVTLFAPFAQWHASLLRGIRKLARWLPWLPIMVPMYLSLPRIFAGSRNAVRPQGHMRAFYPLRFIASLFSADLMAATRAGGLACPVSLITAHNDALFTPNLQACMWDAIAAPCKQRIVLTGGGHLAPFVPLYAAEIATHMAARCQALGFPLSPSTAQHE